MKEKAQRLVLYRRNSTLIMSNTDFQVLEKINQGMLKTFKKRVDGTMPAHTPTIIRRTNSESELIKDDIK
jgi:hypothetical protein